MTYRELCEITTKQLEHNEITLGEYDEMTKPLDEEIRKVGKWIKDYDNSALDGLYHCSVCSRKLWIPKEESLTDYPYCHCGANMRGREE